MNKTLKQYIKTCSKDALYNLFDDVVEEMNRQKEKEEKDEQHGKNDGILLR